MQIESNYRLAVTVVLNICSFVGWQGLWAQPSLAPRPFTICLSIETGDLVESKDKFVAVSRRALKRLELIDFQDPPVDVDNPKSPGCRHNLADGKVPILNGTLTYHSDGSQSEQPQDHYLSFSLEDRDSNDKWKLRSLFTLKNRCPIGWLNPRDKNVGVDFEKHFGQCVDVFEDRESIRLIANRFLLARVDVVAACQHASPCVSINLARNRFWFLLLASASLRIDAKPMEESEGSIKDICSSIEKQEVLSFVPRDSLPPGRGSLEIITLKRVLKSPKCDNP